MSGPTKIHKIKTIIITIILGALGSALFEFGLKDLFTSLMQKLLAVFLYLINNSFYKSIPRSIDTPVGIMFEFFLAGIIVLILCTSNSFRFSLLHMVKLRSIVISVLKVSLLLYLTYTFFVISIAYSVGQSVLMNIEIIAPYIEDIEYKQLKSDFYQIDSKEDFDILTNSIKKISKQYNLQLQNVL